MTVAKTRNGNNNRREASPAADRCVRVAAAWSEIFGLETTGVPRVILRKRVSAGRDPWHQEVFAAIGHYIVDAVLHGDRGVRANNEELLRMAFTHDSSVGLGHLPPVASRYTGVRVREMRHHWRERLGSRGSFRGTKTTDISFIVDNPDASGRDGDLVILVHFEGAEPPTRADATTRLPALHTISLPSADSKERLEHIERIARDILVGSLRADMGSVTMLDQVSFDALRSIVEDACVARESGVKFDLDRSVVRHAPAAERIEHPDARKRNAIQRAVEIARTVLKRPDQEALRVKLSGKPLAEVEEASDSLERASRKGRSWLLHTAGIILLAACGTYAALKVRDLFHDDRGSDGHPVQAAHIVERNGKIAASDHEGRIISDFSADLEDADGRGSIAVEPKGYNVTKFTTKASPNTLIDLTVLPTGDGPMSLSTLEKSGDGIPEQVLLKHFGSVMRDVYVAFLVDKTLVRESPIPQWYTIDFGCGHTTMPFIEEQFGGYLFSARHTYERDGLRTVSLTATSHDTSLVTRRATIHVDATQPPMFASGGVGYTPENLVQWISAPMDATLLLGRPPHEHPIERFRYVVQRDCSDRVAGCTPRTFTTPWSTGNSLRFTPDQPGRWVFVLEYVCHVKRTVERGKTASIDVNMFVPGAPLKAVVAR